MLPLPRIAALLIALGLAACAEPPPPAAAPPNPAASSYMLPSPNVVMEANPPPPFTYWAPEGATIRNHPDVPGHWYAFVGGRQVASYSGNACRASQYQRFVGEPLSAMPELPGAEVRRACETCPVTDDMRPNRINVIFDEATQRITRIACY